MKVESLIFDIDGTLWDSRALVAEGWNRQLMQEGYTDRLVTPEILRNWFGKTSREIADLAFPDLDDEVRMPLMARCMRAEQRVMAADPCRIAYHDVEETLRTLARGYRLFLVSNSEKEYPVLLMEKLGLRDVFRGWLCYGDTGTAKGETIRTLMQRHEISSAAYIGDTQGDAEACAVAGIPFVWCSYGFGSSSRYDVRIDRFAELLSVFDAAT